MGFPQYLFYTKLYMANLFDVFSPLALFGLSLNWGVILFIPAILPSPFWLSSNRYRIAFYKIARGVALEFARILGRQAGPGSIRILVSLLIFIVGNNVLGLFPYVFTPTSHLTITLSLALPLWLGHTLFSWVYQPSYALAHLVPTGTPGALIRFIVVIELLRNTIRPLTLRVRLAANIIAGHLLFALLRNQAPSASLARLIIVIVALILLATLELAVAFIQGYVFSLLSTLYVQDVLTKTLSR